MGLYAVNIGLFQLCVALTSNGGLAGLKQGTRSGTGILVTVILLAIAIPSFNYRYQSAAQATLVLKASAKNSRYARGYQAPPIALCEVIKTHRSSL